MTCYHCMTFRDRLWDPTGYRQAKLTADRYPAVTLPIDCAAAWLREFKPILFLAVLAASAGASSPALNLRLNKEIQQVYATKVAMQGRKSLELVQAMLVSILWIYPPDK